MALKTKAQLIAETSAFIITGGRQTTAANVRTLMGDIYDSLPNYADGGMNFVPEVGYTSDLALSNPFAFTHKKWVEDNFTPITTIPTWSQALTSGANTNGNNPKIDDDDFLLIGSDSQRGIVCSTFTVNKGIVFFNSASGETMNMRDTGGFEVNADLVISNGYKISNSTGDSYISLYGGVGNQFLSQLSDGTQIFANGNTVKLSSDFIGNVRYVETASAGNKLKHDILNTFDAPNNKFTNETANRAAYFDATSNLKSSTVTSTELGYLSGVTSALQTQLNGKEPTITGGTTAQYWRGDKTFQTLNTSVVPEVTNLYFTTARVLATALAGLSITGSSISASDTVLQAFGKLQNQITGLLGGATYQGTYNATTNTPTLVDGTGTKGYYYVVNVAGNQNFGSGIINFNVGDWTIYNGAIWQKVDNTDAVSDVNGAIGSVSLTGTSNRITVTGTVWDIAATYVGQSSITTLGTITTGVWNGTVVADAYIASALTGKTYNGLTITSSTGTLTITNGKVINQSNSLTYQGTDGSTISFGTGGTVAYTSNNLSVFASTTSAQLAGVISDETGYTTGAFLVFSISPALTGSPTAPTQSAGDNSTKIATTAYVDGAIDDSADLAIIAANLYLTNH